MSDLKPCPFCGGDVQLYNIDDDGLGGFSYYYEVVCRHCGLSNKSIYANRDRVENATIKHWNTRPIEDALRKEIAQLQADNRSLAEQMNDMTMKPNQEVIEWHEYPEEKPERSDWYLVITTRHSVMADIYDDQTKGFFEFGNFVKAWAYLPKGVKHD